MNRRGIALCVTLLALAAGRCVHAADYWAYTYKDLDVTAEGTEADAQEVARRLSATDEAMRTLMSLPGGASEPPTRVYVLPQSDLANLDAVWSSQGGAFFRAGPFDDYLVGLSKASTGDREIGAERVRALLVSWGLARLPEWYQHGIALLMSEARFDHDHITVGQDVADRSARLAHDWIPMGEFLRLPANDPMLHRSPDTEATYDAQCWWLVHLSVLDGVLDKVMPPYLQRLMMGESKEAAYAATFGIEPQQLDGYFRKVRHNVKLKQYTNALPDPATIGPPLRLSEAEVKARLAQLLLVHEPRSEAGAQMAADVLAAEPKNERAMLAVARHDLEARRYPQVQESAQRLGAFEDLSRGGSS